MAIFIAYSTSGVISGKKFRRELKMAAILKMSKYLTQLQFDIRNEKIVPNYARKKVFHGDDVIDDVTERPQSLFSIFLDEWKNNIFHDNWRTYKDIIFKLKALMNHWIVNMPLQTIVDCFIDDVIGSQNRSKLWTPIALSIFELEHQSKAQNDTNAHGYLCSIFKFRYHFR